MYECDCADSKVNIIYRVWASYMYFVIYTMGIVITKQVHFHNYVSCIVFVIIYRN